MIDLSTAKNIVIPEGNVIKIKRNGKLAWESAKKWDYGWDYTMGAPDTALWDYPIGTGTAAMESSGLRLTATSASAYSGLRYRDVLNYLGRKAELEIVLSVQSTSGNGIRIILGAGENGASLGYGIQATVNGGYLNVMSGSSSLTTINKTSEFTYNAFHKLLLKTDVDTGDNRIYLDDALVATQTTAQLSTQYVLSVWVLAQNGNVLLQSVKYRRLD